MSEGAQEPHGRERATSPLWFGRIGSWSDGSKRLIKMKFLMLIFVFLQKGWHILERHTTCIFNGKFLHIFSSVPHCLVQCHKSSSAPLTVAESWPIISVYLLSTTFYLHRWIIVWYLKYGSKHTQKDKREQKGSPILEQVRSWTIVFLSKYRSYINNVLVLQRKLHPAEFWADTLASDRW